jgi:hypothetical protein
MPAASATIFRESQICSLQRINSCSHSWLKRSLLKQLREVFDVDVPIALFVAIRLHSAARYRWND